MRRECLFNRNGPSRDKMSWSRPTPFHQMSRYETHELSTNHYLHEIVTRHNANKKESQFTIWRLREKVLASEMNKMRLAS